MFTKCIRKLSISSTLLKMHDTALFSDTFMYVIHIKLIIPHYLLINSTYPDSQLTKPIWTQFPLALCSHLCWRVRYKPKSNVSKSPCHRGRWHKNLGWLPVHLRGVVSSPQLFTQVLTLESAKHQLLKQQQPQPGWDTLHPPSPLY